MPLQDDDGGTVEVTGEENIQSGTEGRPSCCGPVLNKKPLLISNLQNIFLNTKWMTLRDGLPSHASLHFMGWTLCTEAEMPAIGKPKSQALQRCTAGAAQKKTDDLAQVP